MDELTNFVGGKGFQNWLKTATAISLTTKGIEEYVGNLIQNLYVDIKSNCSSLPRCTTDCSKLRGVHYSSWCNTCKKWKDEITKHYYNKSTYKGTPKINWSRVHSQKWTEDIDEVAKVFTPEWYDGSNPITDDLSTSLSFCYNCIDCTIPRTLLNAVKGVRNHIFHTVGPVDENEMNVSFTKLITLLRETLVCGSQDTTETINQISCLRCNDILKIIYESTAKPTNTTLVLSQQIRDTIFDKQLYEGAILTLLGGICLEKYRSVIKKQPVPRTYARGTYLAKAALQLLLFLEIILLLILNLLLTQPKLDRRSHKDCFDTKVSFPVESHVHFQRYLETQRPFVGREWLFAEIQSKLLETKKKGVLLTAEMGYGKSALLSHLACMDSLSSGYMIRERLIGLHFCKFDVLSTQIPEYFIMNLAGTFAKHLPKYKHNLMNDRIANMYIENDEKRCAEDPIGCLDAVLRNPLMDIVDDRRNIWFVAIDGLDECKNNYGKRNIYDILSARLEQFPPFIKFLLTSRNIEAITSDFPSYATLNMDSLDNRNIADIRKMVWKASEETLAFSYLNFLNFGYEKIEEIVNIVKGNFLVLTSIIEHRSAFPDISLDYIPDSLEKIFLSNLKRVFGNSGEMFSKARDIFEVLCVSYNPLEESLLLEIVHSNTDSDFTDTMLLIGNELGHFIARRGNTISLSHSALNDFLTDNSKSHLPFHISTMKGHLKFSRYFIIKMQRNIEAVFSHFQSTEVITHLVYSGSKMVMDDFRNQLPSVRWYFRFIHHTERPLKHLFARDLNSFFGMELIIDVEGKNQLDERNEKNVTALFISTAYGHTDSMKALINNGADIDFIVKDPPAIIDVVDPVMFCKLKAFWGYNLMHIAAQNGHVESVKVLLSRKQQLMYKTNSVGLTPFQLAAEFGHTAIMKVFLEINSSLADQHSLYYAASRGHYNAVKLLLNYGAQHKCIECKKPFYWLQNNVIRKQTRSVYELDLSFYPEVDANGYLKEPTTVFFDDWRLIRCESPLEIAIKNGFTDIVKLFTEQSNLIGMFSCRTYDGRTPILSAARYNRPKVFEILFQGSNISDKCQHQSLIERHTEQLSTYELTMYYKDICPQGATIGHLLAKYADETTISLYNTYIQKWNEEDDDGASPVHYAAQINNAFMISYLLKNKKVNKIPVTKSLMTPFHTAMLHKSYASFYALTDGYGFIPDKKDLEGRSILHFALMSTSNDTYAKDSPEGSIRETVLFIFQRNVGLIYLKDTNGSTMLHYAAMNGHYYVLAELFNIMSTDDFYQLLTSTNNDDKTALDLSIESLSIFEVKDVLRRPYNCSEYDVFKNVCHVSKEHIMSPFDLFVERTLFFLNQYRQKSESSRIRITKLENYMKTAASKGRFYVIVALQTYFPKAFKRVKNLKWKELLEQLSMRIYPDPFLPPLLFPDNCIHCNISYEESALHKFITYTKNSVTIWSDCKTFYSLYLKHNSAEFLNTCYDLDGFNILDRAVISNNWSIMKCLLWYGMTIHKKSNTLEKGITLLLYEAGFANDVYQQSYFSTSSYVQGNIMIEYYVSTENMMTHPYLIGFANTGSKFYGKSFGNVLLHFNVKKSYICEHNKKVLSFVHLAAAKGMTAALSDISYYYGDDVLECKNADGFTPIYFATIFRQTDTVDYMESRNIKLSQPKVQAEDVLLLKLYNHFEVFTPSFNFVTDCQHSSMWRKQIEAKNNFLQFSKCLFDLNKQYRDFVSSAFPTRWSSFLFDKLEHRLKEADTKLNRYSRYKIRGINISTIFECLKLSSNEKNDQSFRINCNSMIENLVKSKRNSRVIFRHFRKRMKLMSKMLREAGTQFSFNLMGETQTIYSKRFSEVFTERSYQNSKSFLSHEFAYLDQLNHPRRTASMLATRFLISLKSSPEIFVKRNESDYVSTIDNPFGKNEDISTWKKNYKIY